MALVSAAITSTTPIQAQTWDGGGADASWETAANWDADMLPTFGVTANITFSSSSTLSSGVNTFLGVGRQIQNLNFGPDVDGALGITLSTAVDNLVDARLTFANTNQNIITVDAGSIGDINIGNPINDTTSLPTVPGSTIQLAGNLTVDHNGSGLLIFTRPISTNGTLSFTKTGSGTFQSNNNNQMSGALNVNGGRVIANGYTTNGDWLNVSAINLGGGTLQYNFASGAGNKFTEKAINAAPATNSGLAFFNPTPTVASTFTLNGTNTLSIGAGANLTVSTLSANVTQLNLFNISRNITGEGNMIVETFNNITSISDNFSRGRVFLTGNNSAWSGNLTIARGTVSLGGNATQNTSGNGTITIGTNGDAFGAGLIFFTSATKTFPNNIIVNPGGFRGIRGSSDLIVTFAGNMTLNGNLTVDHAFSTTDRRINLNGNISGMGGLTVTRTGGSTETTLRMAGANDYLGRTTITAGASLALASTASFTSNVLVQAGGRIGGPGTINANLTLEDTATFYFYAVGSNATTYVPMSVSGTVTLSDNFSVANIVGGSRGEVVNWAQTPDGTYTLISNSSSNLSNIRNFGAANYATIAVVPARYAYFQGTTGLQIVVSSAPPVVSDPYDDWALGLPFDVDSNGDGVENGIAWFFGAESPNSNTSNRLSVGASESGALTLQFDCLNGVDRGGAIFAVQYNSDLTQSGLWAQTEVPGTVGTFTNGVVDFVVTDPDAPGGLLRVTATIPASQAAAGRLFGRVVGQQ